MMKNWQLPQKKNFPELKLSTEVKSPDEINEILLNTPQTDEQQDIEEAPAFAEEDFSGFKLSTAVKSPDEINEILLNTPQTDEQQDIEEAPAFAEEDFSEFKLSADIEKEPEPEPEQNSTEVEATHGDVIFDESPQKDIHFKNIDLQSRATAKTVTTGTIKNYINNPTIPTVTVTQENTGVKIDETQKKTSS